MGVLPPDVEVVNAKVRYGTRTLRSITVLPYPQGGCALPSFVDGHTHPVFAGDRVHEFAMKLAGATYNEASEA